MKKLSLKKIIFAGVFGVSIGVNIGQYIFIEKSFFKSKPESESIDYPKYESEPIDYFKYIPKGVLVRGFDLNMNGIIDTYWWDSNYDGEIQKEVELFFDLDEDGIIDFSYREIIDFLRYNEIHERFFLNEGSV